ncbi:MAG: PepSY-associated TM helix domain-containing protein [Opitutales bacterium]
MSDSEAPIEQQPSAADEPSSTLRRLHRWFWRWHFWPGMFLAPLILIASITGGIYVWKDEVEALTLRTFKQLEPHGERVTFDEIATLSLERPRGAWFTSAPAAVGELAQSPVPLDGEAPPQTRLTFDEIASAALAHTPGALLSINWTGDANTSMEVFIRNAEDETVNVWVNPYTGEVLGALLRDEMFFPMMRDLHRFLWSGRALGDVLPGRLLVELATSWTVLLTISGIVLWWNGTRKNSEQWKLFRRHKPYVNWRNWHTVPAVWLSAVILLVLVTGLTFSKGSGTLWKAGGAVAGAFPKEYLAHPKYDPGQPTLSLETLFAKASKPEDDSALSFVTYAEAGMVPMLLRGDYQNAPWELTFTWIDPVSGDIINRGSYADLSGFAQFLTASYSLHVGSFGGPATKILATLICLLLVFLVVSGVVMWWIRRPKGKSGIPRRQREHLPKSVIAVNVVLAILFPVIGLSLLLMLAAFGLTHLLRDRWLQTG